jgi:protein-tyrosine kinase
MEHIRQAVELAKARGDATATTPTAMQSNSSRSEFGVLPREGNQLEARVVMLNPAHLESNRILAHDVLDPRSKPYEILRTQVLRTMTAQNWQLLAVTSPTPGCGKTLTAINLALSVARQPEKSVLLVDLDMQRPQVATCLGLKGASGLLGVLGGRTALSDAIVEARIGKYRLAVLPCEQSTSHSSEWMASREISDLIQAIRANFSSHVVIFDMPPVLPSDDVISILPQLDCVLLTAAAGISTVSEIEQCNRHLQSAELVRVVLNKTAELHSGYY